MAIHYLKTENPFFQDLWDKKKTFEIRHDDGKGYQIDDTLILQEYDKKKNFFSGREIHMNVPYLIKGKPWLPDDYVCMSVFETYRLDNGIPEI